MLAPRFLSKGHLLGFILMTMTTAIPPTSVGHLIRLLPKLVSLLPWKQALKQPMNYGFSLLIMHHF